MIAMISSFADYCNKNPTYQPPASQVKHELAHLEKRERLSGAAALGCGVLAVTVLAITLIGILGAGYMLFGALAAIALVAGTYSYLCRQAECSLNGKQFTLIK